MKQSRNRSFHDTPQREVLAAVNKHPVVDGISEEIGAEAYQEYHDDTTESLSLIHIFPIDLTHTNLWSFSFAIFQTAANKEIAQ